MSRQKKVFALVVGILVAANALFVTCKQPTSSGSKTVKVTGVTLDQDVIDDLAVGAFASLKATVEPPKASNPKVTWVSSNPQVVEVDQDGIVKAIALGEDVTITVKTNDGGFEATCIVKVVAGALVSGISLNTKSLILYEGFDAPLVAIIEPPNAGNKNVIWTTSNANAAIVDEKTGVVTALAEGNATITATSAESGEFTETCAVEVKKVAGATRVENITLTPTELTLAPGGATSSLTVTVTPPGAENTVIWHSTNTAVATVAEGTVSSGIAGTAVIYATTKDSGKIAVCAVTVRGTPPTPPPGTTLVTGVSLNTNSLDLNTGETATLTPMVEPSGEPPAGATNKTVNWSTSNRTIATVDSSGKVSAIAAGFAVIIATTADGGYTATCGVTVQTPGPAIIPVTKIELDEHSLTLTVGEESDALTYTLTPTKPTNENVTWRSNNNTIATVGQDGVVRAVRVGSTSIMVTTVSGGCYDVCDVEVRAVVIPATGITLDAIEITIDISGNDTLQADVLPPGANQEVIWTVTRGSEYINVNNGTITGKGLEGEATVRATVKDYPIFYAECDVIVEEFANAVQVSGVRLAPSSLTLDVGESTTMIEIVEPPEARSRSVTWKAEPSGIVDINTRGVVTARAPGTATITVTTVQVPYSATCTVRVRTPTEINIPVTGVTLDKAALILREDAPPATLKATVYPSIATEKGLEWYSTDETVVMVEGSGDDEGIVNVINAGSALIYVTTKSSGKVAVCMVTVSNSIFDGGGATEVIIKQNGEAAPTVEMLTTDDPISLTASVKPDNVSQTVTWASLNTRVVTVVNGVVTPVSAGITVITATAGNGVMGACAVIVNNPPPSVIPLDRFSLIPNVIELKIGESISPYISYVPNNTTERGVSWSSSSDLIATVDNTGKIVAQGYGVNSEEVYGDGVATITASSVIEGKTNINASIKVTVTRSAIFTISFDQLGDAAPPIEGKTLSMKSTAPVEFILSNPSQYDAIKWTVNGTDDVIEETAATLSLTASQFTKYGLGTFTITLEVKTKTTTTPPVTGRWYSKTIDLELVE
jgi:uncharacterized protein YjdB